MPDKDAMPEPTDAPANPAPPEDAGDDADAGAPEGSSAAPETPSQAPSRKTPRKGGRWLAWMVILALLPIGWFMLPAQTRQHLTAALTSGSGPDQTSPEPPASESGASLPSTEETPATAEPGAESTPVAAPAPESPAPQATPAEPVAPSPAPAASSEEVQALMEQIRALRGDLESLRTEASALRQSLRRQQELLLRDRLRRIVEPHARLAEMRAAWRDIGLLPMLGEDDRALAKRMQEQAERDMERIAAWQRQLEALAASLPEWKGRDIIPQPRQPALAWLAGKFHLRRAPGADQRAQAELRARLLRAAHALAMQDWPRARDWRHLLMDVREQFGDEAELKLPERLDDIQANIAAIRQQAAGWLGRL